MALTSSIQPLIDYFQARLPLSEYDQSLLGKVLKAKRFLKGDHLLMAGDTALAFWFCTKGWIRMYYSKGGNDRTTYFYTQGEFVSAYDSFIHQRPALMYFQALTDVEVLEISSGAAEQLLSGSKTFEALARIGMEEEMVVNQHIIASLLTQTPEERYMALLEDQPSIFQTIPQHYIASFLGVQPESLSRIKRRAQQRRT
ncbi:MAG TPA: Crp/Fnr family transcriptional regulator [Cytophagales bacterium]|nr:Crp/Fnr family transcriptional regulator [Cytophagales bacterium]HAP60697.1 Crp/Fnr family transcriptional regulator [Cytophagales bacterium]